MFSWLLLLGLPGILQCWADCVAEDDATSQLQLGVSRSCKQRLVTVDTNMDIDDMMALVYLLTESSIDVAAITVASDGWSTQFAGVSNAMRLTQKFGKTSIPVAYMDGYLGKTQLNINYPNELPPFSYLNGTSTFLTNWVPTPGNPRPAAWESAPQLINRILKNANGPVDILALGPWTNLAAALHMDSDTFRTKVGTIYVSGGYINGQENKSQSNRENIVDAIKLRRKQAKTAGYPYSWHPEGATWNIFGDPISAAQVFSSGIDLVMMLSNAEDMITVNESDSKYIPASCPEVHREYLTSFYKKFAPACDETMSDVRYWDPSAALLMAQLLPNCGKDHAVVCTKWSKRPLKVNLEEGGTFAWTDVSAFGTPVRMCLEANGTNFKEAFFASGCDLQYDDLGLAKNSKAE